MALTATSHWERDATQNLYVGFFAFVDSLKWHWSTLSLPYECKQILAKCVRPNCMSALFHVHVFLLCFVFIRCSPCSPLATVSEAIHFHKCDESTLCDRSPAVSSDNLPSWTGLILRSRGCGFIPRISQKIEHVRSAAKVSGLVPTGALHARSLSLKVAARLLRQTAAVLPSPPVHQASTGQQKQLVQVWGFRGF